MNSQEFIEAIALTLCLPSPACRDKVGSKIGKDVVDMYGDKVMSQNLPGDHYRTRHDKIKMTLNSLLTWCRIPTTCEVWGLFSHLIPNEALSRMESGRKRQGLVPDFRVEVPDETGRTKYQLAELKVVSCCDTWYRPGSSSNTRATDRRAQGLQSDYLRKAKNIDKNILGVNENEKGPVERRLNEFGEIIGLCFGAWGEGSEDVHKLVNIIAESRLKHQGLKFGKPGSKYELGMLVGQVRRRLSVATLKAQVNCLLSRLHQVGPGNSQLAKKREWAVAEDERMRLERKAQWMRKYEGIQTLTRGFIVTA